MKRTHVPMHVLVLVLAIAVGSLAALASANCVTGSSGSSAEWLHYFTAEDRLARSEVVVRATLLGEEEHSRPMMSPVTDQAHGEIRGVLREYRVVETFKGEDLKGEIIYVGSDSAASIARPMGDMVVGSGLVELSVGAEYILFLRPRPALESDPAKIGDTRWSHWGEPGLAMIEDGELRFLATRTYTHAVEERGESPAISGSAAPFRFTVDDLYALRDAEGS